MPIHPRRTAAPLLALALAACRPGAADENGVAASDPRGCEIVQPSTPLPAGLGEASGAAASRAHPGVFWTHNDSGGEPLIYAVRTNGQPVGTVEVHGAESRDWEDIAIGPCASGSCLYVADTGDNQAKRDRVSVYRIPEPRPGAADAHAEELRLRYPGGPRDAEALFVLPDGGVYLVTKGRESSVALYRYPASARPGKTVELEHLVDLTAGKQPTQQQVTGASASPSGEWVSIRTYRSLMRFRTEDLLAGRPAAEVFDLSQVGEAQGEGVVMLDDERVLLTSEGGFDDAPGTVAVLRCPLPAGEGER